MSTTTVANTMQLYIVRSSLLFLLASFFFPADLSSDLVYFFSAPIGQGYGLTETCAGGTFSDYDDTSVGRVGPPLPCSYIKVK